MFVHTKFPETPEEFNVSKSMAINSKIISIGAALTIAGPPSLRFGCMAFALLIPIGIAPECVNIFLETLKENKIKAANDFYAGWTLELKEMNKKA